jgi:hypothetical protein
MRLQGILLCSAALALPLACGNGAPPATAPTHEASSASAPAATSEPAPSASATTATSASASAEPRVVIAGGACAYAKQKGLCEITAGGTFTFKGVVDGASVTLPGNPLGPTDKSPAVGTSLPCTIEFITQGTCTPCMFSLGACGQNAWEAFRKHK